MRHLKTGWILILGVVVLVGCGGKQEEAAPTPEPEAAPEPVEMAASATASVEFQSREGMTITGSIGFEETEGAGLVVIAGSVAGAPAGSHGLHIHEIGDCSAADFKSSGGHFNPAGVPHAGPMDSERHGGDLGNIEIGADGTGSIELSSDLITLAVGAENSIVGRAVILHEGEDDLVSQPTGDAGGRIACGVITGG